MSHHHNQRPRDDELRFTDASGELVALLLVVEDLVSLVNDNFVQEIDDAQDNPEDFDLEKESTRRLHTNK